MSSNTIRPKGIRRVYFKTQPRIRASQRLEQADTAWSRAIQSYATSLSQVSYPASAQADADAAHAAALAAVSAVNALAASPDVQSYSTASTSPAFQAALHNVDSTYNRLLDTLANG